MPVAWVGLAGAAISAVGAISQGAAQSQQSAYQAQVAQNNSTVENQNALYATEAGNIQQFDESLKNRGAAGKIKANQAANGVDVNSGSNLAVQQSQRETGLQDVATIGANAQRQAYGYRTQAVGDTAQAGLDTAESQQAPVGADLGAVGGLLSKSGSNGIASAFGWTGSGS